MYASFLYFLKRIVFVNRHVWFFRIYKERRLIVTNRYDYWEISTYVNGRKTGLFESRYVKNDAVRETGEYLNGRRVGRWKMYDIDGKLEKEWEETKQYRDE